MDSSPSISALLQLAKQGDGDAAEQLFGRMGNEGSEGAELLAVVRRLMPRSDRARVVAESRDFFHSALRSGWIDIADFRGTTKAELFAWLRTIVRRKIGRAVQKRRAQLISDEDSHEEPNVEENSPLGGLIRREAVKRLEHAIHELEENQRLVMQLSLRGASTQDIADQLGLTLETVRKRRSRAAARLRELMTN